MSMTLVALGNGAARIHVSAALVARGVRIVLARSVSQLAGLLAFAEVCIVDAALLRGLRPSSGARLRRVPVVVLAGRADPVPDDPAVAVFRPPFDLDDLVTVALHVGRPDR